LAELQHRHDEQTRELHDAREHLTRQEQVLQLEVSEFTNLSAQHQSLSQKHDELAAELDTFRAREQEHLTAQSSLSVELQAVRDREAEFTQTIARLTAAHDAAVSIQSELQVQLEEARVSRPVATAAVSAAATTAATLPSTPAPHSAHAATPVSVSQSSAMFPEDVGSLKAQLEETNTKLRKYATLIKQMKADKETHMQELVAANNRTAAAHAAHQVALQEVPACMRAWMWFCMRVFVHHNCCPFARCVHLMAAFSCFWSRFVGSLHS
jgi:chromosome segregation ATPase